MYSSYLSGELFDLNARGKAEEVVFGWAAAMSSMMS